ncbi:MAG: NUDIX domain-containing protein [Bacteroidetes bacterium]|nr:MAG: NUDIX domain-containing protein [Bacteroidota bacterium]TAG87441.1 MAG: NUDIX domain-containing protein [Bacteroidota bacterium]
MTEKKYPITTVGALIFNEKNEFLLVKTYKWKGKYGVPGGKIDMGETAEYALHREIKEETNLSVENVKFIVMQDCIFSEEFHTPKHFIFLNYSCVTKNPEEIILNDEAHEYIWVNKQEAAKMDLNLPTKKLIEMIG